MRTAHTRSAAIAIAALPVLVGAGQPTQHPLAELADDAAHTRLINDHLLLGLAPREATPKPAAIAKPQGPHRLVVKFRDTLQARALAGQLTARADEADTLAPAVRLATDNAFTYRQLIELPDSTIDRLELAAAARTGFMPIDLRSMMVVQAPQDQLERIAAQLLALDTVEWVDFEPLTPTPPPCTDIAPPTSSFVATQNYRGPNPGVNIDAAWALGDARGAGVNIADIEYYFHPNHEDLCNVIEEPGITIPSFVFSNQWDNHGTAVLGILNAQDNGYGMTGLAPDAQAYFFPEWDQFTGSRRGTAIVNASATLNEGDIIVLEMQTGGAGGGFAPAEYSQSVWTATKIATDAGRIVIAAAGNGDQDLDSPPYQPYMNRGDSGAIIVGAGSANTAHNKLSFSTFGQRVNVQGWGQSVASLGYGGLANPGGDPNQRYTSTFSGTSSATPVVAGSAASIQSYAGAQFGQRLTPPQMRQLLIDTGLPQGSGGNIGPFPDVIAARNAVQDYLTPPPAPPIITTPTDGQLVDIPVQLAWTPDQNTQTVTLIVDDDQNLASPIVSATLAVDAVPLTDTVLSPGTTYYWQLTANGPGGSTTGQINTFTTSNPTTPCPTDTNSDGVTDLDDLLTVLANFGSPGAQPQGDTNADNLVDLADLLAVLAEFAFDCP